MIAITIQLILHFAHFKFCNIRIDKYFSCEEENKISRSTRGHKKFTNETCGNLGNNLTKIYEIVKNIFTNLRIKQNERRTYR